MEEPEVPLTRDESNADSRLVRATLICGRYVTWRPFGEVFPAHDDEVHCWPFEQNIRTIPPERHPDYSFEVRRFFQITASAVAIVTILLGTRYAYSRESVHNLNLHEQYQQINRESFDAKLPNVSVNWADLSALNTDGITSFDDYDRPLSIELDRKRITSERDLRAVIRHNACHVLVGGKAAHGSAWQRCMNRF